MLDVAFCRQTDMAFYALNFGEKPPHSSIRPMQPRGADQRAHIFSEHPPNPLSNKMQATSSWAPRHTDPLAATTEGGAPQQPRVHTSALLQKRERNRELAVKPQDVPHAATEVPTIVKSGTTREAPFAVTAEGFSATRASQSYGAFAAPTPKIATPPPVQNNVHDYVPSHTLLSKEPSQGVIGTFAPHPKPNPLAVETSALDTVVPHPDPLKPTALNSFAEEAVQPKHAPIVVDRSDRNIEAKAEAIIHPYRLPTAPLPVEAKPEPVDPSPAGILQGAKKDLPPKPTSVIPDPKLPRTALSLGALQTLGNWQYQHTPHYAAGAAAAKNKPVVAQPDNQDTVSIAASGSVVPASAPGPQVDWWVKQQHRYQQERRQEAAAPQTPNGAAGGAGGVSLSTPRPDTATKRPPPVTSLSRVAGPVNVSTTPSAAPPSAVARAVAASKADVPLPAPSAANPLAPGTHLVVNPDGSLRVVPPAEQPQPTVATLGPKPQELGKTVTANLPPPAPYRPVSAIPIGVTAALRAAPVVVQSVGGPAPTSIARSTMDAIREERNAQAKVRWLAEAPARAEALQRKIQSILHSLRASVEAKGFSEPTKGAQYIIKVCREQTSTPHAEMDYDGFVNVLSKGFSLSLPDDVMDALFARMDREETTVVPFRVFGETVFGLLKPTSAADAMDSSIRNPAVRLLLETIKTKIARRNGGEAWLLAFQRAFKTINQVSEDKVGTSGRQLTAKDLHTSLTRLGIGPLTLHDANDLVTAMDVNKNGTIDEEEFLYAMRGPVSRKRRALIFRAFNTLDADKNGVITLCEIAARYNAKDHPRVLSGESSEEDVLREFVTLWNRDNDDIVSWKEFLDYYKTLSASIENDDYFELMMRNCWRMSGGEGVAQNTACRRVLVTFYDKTQKVIEIENDLGIGPKDLDKMINQLHKQGVKNIERIELYN